MASVLEIDGFYVPVGTHENKKIIIGSDHRGFAYKEEIIKFLKEAGYDLDDVGTYSADRCDYPPISDEIGRRLSAVNQNVGIGVCGSGVGILVPASKHRNVYVARCLKPDDASTSRRHNNTNMLGIGSDCVDIGTAIQIVHTWLTTPFYSGAEDGAYLRRYVQTMKLESALFGT
jgi:ribose 5-phosphate isomerase B